MNIQNKKTHLLHTLCLVFNIFCALNLPLINCAVASDHGEKEPAHFWALPHLEQTIFNWTPHPEADLYRLEVDGVAIEDSTTSFCQTNLSPALQSGSEVELQANKQGQWHSIEKLTISQGESYLQPFSVQQGSVVADYRLVSFPAGASVWDGEKEVTPLSFMKAHLGLEHHPSNWICGTWDPSTGQYIEASQMDVFMPGRSYWMISNWNMTFDMLGQEPQHDEVQVLLQPGWNMVSSPYPRSGSWANLSVQDEQQTWTQLQLLEGEDPPLWPSIWGWAAGHYQELLSYESGQGFWLLNRRQHEIGLLISKRERFEHESISKSKPYRSSLSKVSPPAPPASLPAQNTASPPSIGGGGGCLLQVPSSSRSDRI